MYRDHKDIPKEYRARILEETLEKRVAKVPLQLCNEIIQMIIEEEAENELLKSFEVQVLKDGKKTTVQFGECKKALAYMDQVIGPFEKDPNIVVALYQAGRILRGYVKGKMVYAP